MSVEFLTFVQSVEGLVICTLVWVDVRYVPRLWKLSRVYWTVTSYVSGKVVRIYTLSPRIQVSRLCGR